MRQDYPGLPVFGCLAEMLKAGVDAVTITTPPHTRRDLAGSLEVSSTGGLLRDLGNHLVDQMLWLLGPARLVHATLDWTDRFGERTDCGFAVTMTHASGAVSTVSASKLNHLRRLLR